MGNSQIRNQLRKLHKWVFIYMGIFMLLWVVSGLVISIPMAWMDVHAGPDRHVVDYAQATLSPAEAARKAAADSGPGATVTSLSTQKILDRLLYVVRLDGGREVVIDAAGGDYFEFTPALAERIVRSRYGIDATLVENTRLEKHDLGYPWGPLPVSRLRFAGEHADADFYVNHQSGGVRSGTLLTRLRFAAGVIHSLEPIEFVTGSEKLHRAVLVLLGLITLLGVIPGLYLTLPRRKRKVG